jgi:hypothetical protein
LNEATDQCEKDSIRNQNIALTRYATRNRIADSTRIDFPIIRATSSIDIRPSREPTAHEATFKRVAASPFTFTRLHALAD